ncbi:MAG TPA: glycerol kinase [Gammaproteobacteria bacterium]|nr:glycerol kinase [Gammaproteobacteria bacterium]
MSKNPVLLAIDQGTTSSRAILFQPSGRPLCTAQQEFDQIYPDDGWVEHNPEQIWQSSLQATRRMVDAAQSAAQTIAGIGITNQRETTLVWDRKTGQPLYNAIVWQDRRTAAYCADLKREGYEILVREKTGLLLDPYFSATKIHWILQQVSGARTLAQQGRLAFGTTDSFLIWRLSGGRVHATDATNASRTLLFNIHRQCWDPELLELFDIPESMLPEVKNCADDFGHTDPTILGQQIPICGVAGDQQAAAFGQACLSPGMTKSTYGTGCFALMNTGASALTSQHKLLTTVAYRLDGKTSYALEGSIFVAGAAVQWLRDRLQIIQSAAETEALAASLDSNKGVYLVPAFTGLGVPYWDPDARGTLSGLTRDSGRAEIVRATLEAVCYQTRDLIDAMQADGANFTTLRVDGGMVVNRWLMQFLADIIQVTVEVPVVTETTALGAAFLAGLQQGLVPSTAAIDQTWQCRQRYLPIMDEDKRQALLAGWDRAIARVLTQP